MTQLSGLGINYNYRGTGSNLANDQAFLTTYFPNKIVRLNLYDYKGAPDFGWRSYATSFLSKGYYVIYGINCVVSHLSVQDETAYTNAMIGEANWCQTQNNPNLEFQIVNELEVEAPFRITSLTRSGTTATAVTDVTCTFVNGESVTVSNATQPEYNGTFTIFGATTTGFQYTISGSPVSPATSVAPIRAQDLTSAQLRAFTRNLATTARQHYTLGKISAAISTGVTIFGGENNITAWASEGLGSLSCLGFNVYAGGGFPDVISYQSFTFDIDTIVANFAPGQAYLSEWGPSSGGFVTNFQQASYTEFTFSTITNDQINYIQASGITPALYYNYMDNQDKYGVKLRAGGYRLNLSPLIVRRPWYTPGQATLTRGGSIARSASIARPTTPNRPSFS